MHVSSCRQHVNKKATSPHYLNCMSIIDPKNCDGILILNAYLFVPGTQGPTDQYWCRSGIWSVQKKAQSSVCTAIISTSPTGTGTKRTSTVGKEDHQSSICYAAALRCGPVPSASGCLFCEGRRIPRMLPGPRQRGLDHLPIGAPLMGAPFRFIVGALRYRSNKTPEIYIFILILFRWFISVLLVFFS